MKFWTYEGRLDGEGARQGMAPFPVVLHADQGPAAPGGFVEAFVESADMRGAVVGPLAGDIGVVDVEAEAGAFALVLKQAEALADDWTVG